MSLIYSVSIYLFILHASSATVAISPQKNVLNVSVFTAYILTISTTSITIFLHVFFTENLIHTFI